MIEGGEGGLVMSHPPVVEAVDGQSVNGHGCVGESVDQNGLELSLEKVEEDETEGQSEDANEEQAMKSSLLREVWLHLLTIPEVGCIVVQWKDQNRP